MAMLDQTAHTLSVILVELEVGDCLELKPDVAEYSVAMGYLLAARLLVTMFKTASSEVRILIN